MAYVSSTVGSTGNPPILVTQGISTVSLGFSSSLPSTGTRPAMPKQWYYNSTHTQLICSSAGFFTDGRLLGMSLGDSVFVIGSTTYVISHHVVNDVTSTGVTISAGLLISSAS